METTSALLSLAVEKIYNTFDILVGLWSFIFMYFQVFLLWCNQKHGVTLCMQPPGTGTAQKMAKFPFTSPSLNSLGRFALCDLQLDWAATVIIKLTRDV